MHMPSANSVLPFTVTLPQNIMWSTLTLLSLIKCSDHASPHNCLSLQEYVASSPLGKSGCLAAFALIFLSEIGDKTFFIAALLAMRVGKWLSFTGSVAALSLMTFVSVGIGVVFKNVPDQFSSSIPIGQYLGIALLVYFGLKTLKVRCTATLLSAENCHSLSVELMQLQRNCMMFSLQQAVELPVSSCKLHTKVLDEATDIQSSNTIAISDICCRMHMKCTKMAAHLYCSTRLTKLHTWHHSHAGCTLTAVASAASTG